MCFYSTLKKTTVHQCAAVMDSDMRRSSGRLVQNLGAAIAKARSLLVFSRGLGCTESSWLEDLSALLGLYKSRRSVR